MSFLAFYKSRNKWLPKYTWISHNKMKKVSYLASTRLLDSHLSEHLLRKKSVFKIWIHNVKMTHILCVDFMAVWFRWNWASLHCFFSSDNFGLHCSLDDKSLYSWLNCVIYLSTYDCQKLNFKPNKIKILKYFHDF